MTHYLFKYFFIVYRLVHTEKPQKYIYKTFSQKAMVRLHHMTASLHFSVSVTWLFWSSNNSGGARVLSVLTLVYYEWPYMHACLFVCLSACLYECMFACITACLYVSLPACLYVDHMCLFVCLFACLYVDCILVCLPVCRLDMLVCQLVCLFIYLSVCRLYACLSVYLPVCM